MKKYSDQENTSGMKVIFMLAQMLVVMVVYSIGYTSFVAIQLSMKGTGTSNWSVYLPIMVILFIFPILLRQYRKIFNQGRMLAASVWMMATASLSIVLLYMYADSILG